MRLPRVDHRRQLVDDLLHVDAAGPERVAAVLEPLIDVAGELGVELHAPRQRAEPDGLRRAVGRRQHRCAVGWDGDVLVPRQGSQGVRQAAEQRVVGGPKVDRQEADAGPPERPGRSAERLRHQLHAEADAERRHLPHDRLAVEGAHLGEPRMCHVLVRVHDAAEANQAGDLARVQRRCRRLERAPRVDLAPGREQGRFEDAEESAGRVLEDEDAKGHVTRKRHPHPYSSGDAHRRRRPHEHRRVPDPD